MKKSLLSILLTLSLLVAALPLTPILASAAVDTGGLTVSGGIAGVDYDYASGELIIKSATPLTVKNKNASVPAADSIAVASGAKADITLAGVNIKIPEDTAASAILIRDDTVLTLAGENTVTIAKSDKAIDVKGGLTVKGNGSLSVTAKTVI